jgi:pimeloyl-ACP methyl ester carboxylesterase
MTVISPLILIPGLLCTDKLFAPQLIGLRDLATMTVAAHRQHDTLAAIAAAVLATAPPQFALAGLSMGGYIAFEMIRQAPQRVTRLALLDTSARADRPEQVSRRGELLALARTEGLVAVNRQLLPLLVHPRRTSDAALCAIIDDMATATGVDAFARQQAAIMGRPDNRPFLAAIRVPTMIIVGAEDALTPVKVHEEMQAGIAGSTLHVVPDCGHLSTLEAPAAVNDLLAQWLASPSLADLSRA